MLSIRFGKVKRHAPPRIDVTLAGFEDETVATGVLVPTVGGQNADASAAWFPYAEGDVVAVLYDGDNPQNSLILGGVYGDGDKLHGDAKKINLAANGVNLGHDLTDGALSFVARAKELKENLDAIKTALDTLKSAIETHTHVAVPTLSVTPSGAVSGAVTINAAGTQSAHGYAVTDTASKSVKTD